MARFQPENKRPWLIPLIVVVAVVVVAVGLIATVVAGGRIF